MIIGHADRVNFADIQLEGSGVQGRLQLFCLGRARLSKNENNKVIVWRRTDLRSSADGQQGVPGFMVNLYLYKNSGMGSDGLVRWSYQPIHQKNVLARPGCIHRVLRSTLR